MLQIFGWGPCRLGVFGLVSMSAEHVNTHDQSPGGGHALWLRRDPVDDVDNIVVDR